MSQDQRDWAAPGTRAYHIVSDTHVHTHLSRVSLFFFTTSFVMLKKKKKTGKQAVCTPSPREAHEHTWPLPHNFTVSLLPELLAAVLGAAPKGTGNGMGQCPSFVLDLPIP